MIEFHFIESFHVLILFTMNNLFIILLCDTKINITNTFDYFETYSLDLNK